jgi:hypothetical protein
LAWVGCGGHVIVDDNAGLTAGTGGTSGGTGGSGTSTTAVTSGTVASSTGSTSTSSSSGTGGAPSGWHTLITGDWKLLPGTEEYLCVQKTLDQDYWIGGFESINPPGTHHTLFSVGQSDGQDGIFPCSSLDNKDAVLFGSGVGTNPLVFPDGVAVHLKAGQQIMLNLHLFNASASDLGGQSGTRGKLIDPASVKFEADSILAGTINLYLPPNQQTKTLGTCTLGSTSTLFAIQPHMHQLGSHMKVTAQTANGDVVLHDAPYNFSDQAIYPIAPFSISAGDTLRVECTHINPTSAPVNWGESSNAEMCHAGVYRYPGSSEFFFCMN